MEKCRLCGCPTLNQCRDCAIRDDAEMRRLKSRLALAEELAESALEKLRAFREGDGG